MNFTAFWNMLPYLLFGMLGIFVVIGVIVLLTMFLNYIPRPKKDIE